MRPHADRVKIEADGVLCEFTRVHTRRNLKHALNHETGLDLILADFSLPAYDGSTALARARERQPDVPFCSCPAPSARNTRWRRSRRGDGLCDQDRPCTGLPRRFNGRSARLRKRAPPEG